jgi:phosphoribosylaminoimidazole carboxylase PurE protein
MSDKPIVAVIMGSDSDLPMMESAVEVLKEFAVPFEVRVLSAHRSPQAVHEFASGAEKKGLKVIIAGAGGAAHLAGVVASLTTLPVIGVPMPTECMGGLDSLLSILQMPGGVPVATMGIGKSGARNAALLAVQMLALTDEKLRKALRERKAAMADKVKDADQRVQQKAREKG